jgi:hypothetical protein
MNKRQFADLLVTIQRLESEVREAGQAEYAHGEQNCFANFDRISERLGIPPQKVLLTYATKHWDGITAYVNGHKSQREDIRGRIKDLRLYLALLWGMIERDITGTGGDI